MEYVCTGAILKCSEGTNLSTLNATSKNVTLTGKDQANITDSVTIKNIQSFGLCKTTQYPATGMATAANHGIRTPMPCVPGTALLSGADPKWSAEDPDSLVCGEPALLKQAVLKCRWGGEIKIVNPGQNLEIKK